MNSGILYITTGKHHTREAQKSAKSIRNHTNIPIVLFTDSVEAAGDVFTDIREIKSEGGYYNKVKYISNTPFKKTLYLDADTYINSDISDIFKLLNKYDLGISQDPTHTTHKLQDLPRAFPEYNTGVILYDTNKDSVNKLLNRWFNIYSSMEEDYNSKDQPAFRRALYQTKVNFITITREWNCFYNFPGYVAESPNILHGRLPSPKRAADIISGPGVYRRTWFRLQFKNSNMYIPGYMRIISRSIKENGFQKTLRRIISKLK